MEELGMSTMTGNPTYNLTAMSRNSTKPPFGDADIWDFPPIRYCLPKLYWIPKLHKNPYMQRYLLVQLSAHQASSDSNTNTNRSEGLQKYCDTAMPEQFIRCGS